MRKPCQLVYLQRLQESRNPQGNRTGSLKGDRRGQYSIRINDLWRICFRWNAARREGVEIDDYH
ncbi:plasmid maintenance system killer protein [Corynebacterium liangguodongii]|uniref:Plasmid maintenance system killer protein n=1 Tax=Corynebacterium liangguodongii TaxID=2079535 RepID=A0A2S0WGY7_9CORY|nr:plasmid maintenance system killer protein [Corynebacterium liangguodongii]PWB99595.1 plasmid maintenance system killer protein [Corynebacterium liangguodongii]